MPAGKLRRKMFLPETPEGMYIYLGNVPSVKKEKVHY